MRSQIQVFEGTGEDTEILDEMTTYIIQEYPDKFAEADRGTLMKHFRKWLNCLNRISPGHGQPYGTLKLWRQIKAEGRTIPIPDFKSTSWIDRYEGN